MKPNKIRAILKASLPYLIRFGILLVLIVALWGFVYKFSLKYDDISNSIFIVSITTFFITLLRHTGATRLLIPLNYSAKYVFRYNNLKEKYDGYHEYYDDVSPGHKRDMKKWIIPAILLIIVALIFATLYFKTKN